MSLDGFYADPEGLRSLAGDVRDGQIGLGDTELTAPIAGQSSAGVSDALADILASTADLLITMEIVAQRIDESAGSYGSVDNIERYRFGGMVAE